MAGSTPYFYLRDPHGDIVGSVTTAAAYQTTRSFDSFGKTLATSQVSGSQPVLGYQGDLTDPVTNLVDEGTRYYMPTTDRFMTRDSVAGDPRNPMSLNRFAYGDMNPITMSDPTGMAGCDNQTGRCGTGYTNNKGQYVHQNPDGTKSVSGSGGYYDSTDTSQYVEPVPAPPAPAPQPSLFSRAVHNVAESVIARTPIGAAMTEYEIGRAYVTGHPPDYLTLNVNGGDLAGGTLDLTLTRDGGFYFGGGPGVFTEGGGGSLSAGWIDGSGATTAAQRDNFVHGWSVQAGGSVPVPGLPVNAAGQEVWGQPGRFGWSSTGHEIGIGNKSDPYAYATGTYQWRLPFNGPSW